jgi:hypothetical protein
MYAIRDTMVSNSDPEGEKNECSNVRWETTMQCVCDTDTIYRTATQFNNHGGDGFVHPVQLAFGTHRHLLCPVARAAKECELISAVGRSW